jgi:hypothetical protein
MPAICCACRTGGRSTRSDTRSREEKMRFLPQFELTLHWSVRLVIWDRYVFVEDGIDDLGGPIL